MGSPDRLHRTNNILAFLVVQGRRYKSVVDSAKVVSVKEQQLIGDIDSCRCSIKGLRCGKHCLSLTIRALGNLQATSQVSTRLQTPKRELPLPLFGVENCSSRVEGEGVSLLNLGLFFCTCLQETEDLVLIIPFLPSTPKSYAVCSTAWIFRAYGWELLELLRIESKSWTSVVLYIAVKGQLGGLADWNGVQIGGATSHSFLALMLLAHVPRCTSIAQTTYCYECLDIGMIEED